MGSSHQPCISWDSSDGAVGWGQCWGFSESTFGVPLSPTPSNASPQELGQRGCAACPGVARLRGAARGRLLGEQCCGMAARSHL